MPVNHPTVFVGTLTQAEIVMELVMFKILGSDPAQVTVGPLEALCVSLVLNSVA